MARSKRAQKTALYSVTLSVNGTQLIADGETVQAALLDLPKFDPKTRGTFIISSEGKTSKPIILNIPMLKRLFYPGMTGVVQRTIFGKRVAFLT